MFFRNEDSEQYNYFNIDWWLDFVYVCFIVCLQQSKRDVFTHAHPPVRKHTLLRLSSFLFIKPILILRVGIYFVYSPTLWLQCISFWA